MTTVSLPQYQYEIGARMARADWAGASAVAAACRADWPADASGWLLGSIAALFADDKVTALSLIDERLLSEPANTQCLIQKAECLLALGRRQAAMTAAEAAIDSAELLQALDAVGEFLVHAGDHSRALELYDRLVAAAPQDVSYLSKRAVIQRFLGNFESAIQDYERVLALAPADSEALKGLAELRRQ
jgi:tetratricopeptide (TPR) repeat protein